MCVDFIFNVRCESNANNQLFIIYHESKFQSVFVICVAFFFSFVCVVILLSLTPATKLMLTKWPTKILI